MIIRICEDPETMDTEVVIRCRKTDEKILKIMATLRAFDDKITGIKNGETYILEAEKILYIDTADKKTFLYTRDEVYETALKLYELEERLASNDFFRASKSSIVNFNEIQSLRPEFGGRMILTMTNGEKMVVSRQYSGIIKEKLGL